MGRHATFTSDEDARIVADANNGISRIEIAAALERNVQSIYDRIRILRSHGIKISNQTGGSRRATASSSRKKESVRPCLCCTVPFLSEGDYNRLCNKCRGRSFTPFDAPTSIAL